MANLLTPHSLRAIHDSDVAPVPGYEKPVLQVLAVKQIANNNPVNPNPTERWRIVLSDGTNFIQAMLATQLNSLVHSTEIAKGKLVRINSYSINKMKEKKYCPSILSGAVANVGDRLLIVLSCTVLNEVGELEKLGTPVALVEEGAAATSTTTPAPSVQQPVASAYQQGRQPPQQQLQQSRSSQYLSCA
jgi:replication factor A1